MSSFIVVEALALVTWWGLGRLLAPLRRLGRGGKQAAVPRSTSASGADASSGTAASSGAGWDSGEPDELRVR